MMGHDPSTGHIESAFATFVAAMQLGDTDRLRGLTDDRFTLTHITGYVQPGDEWLEEMAQGQFVYHQVRVRDQRVTANGARAQLIARTLTDARVYGTRNEWRLQLALDYARRGENWIAQRAVATLWS